MNGQMIVQMTPGAVLDGASPRQSPAAAAPAGEQGTGAFAAILGEMSGQDSTASPATPMSATTVNSSPVVNDAASADEEKMPDVSASLLTALGTAAEPLLIVAKPAEKPHAVEQRQTEVKMPQNVEVCAAGAQAVLAPQFDGRMPTSEQEAIPQDNSREQFIAADAQKQTQQIWVSSLAGENIASSAETFARPALTGNEEKMFPHVSDGGVTPDKETAAVQTVARSAANLEKIAIIQPQQLVPTATVSITEQAKTAPEAPESDSLVKTVASEQEKSGPRQAVPKSEAANVIPMIRPRDAEFSGNTPEVRVLSAVVADKPAPVIPGGFKFSRSTAVDVVLANSQHVSERTPEKSENGSTGPKVADAKPSGLLDTTSNETGFAFSGKEFTGFTQQTPEAPHPVVQHIPAAHRSFAVETAASAPLQVAQAGPDIHDNVAGQVRERLGAHDIKTGSDQIVFRLSPENLGEIKVHLKLGDQRLMVEIVAENRMARESLLQHVDSLKESLSRQNISIDKFTVTSGESQAGSQGGSSAQNEWRELARNRQSQQWLTSGGYRLPSEEVPQAYQPRTEHAMLDLHF